MGCQWLDCFLGTLRNGPLHKLVSEQVSALTYFFTNSEMRSSINNSVVITYTSMVWLIQIPLLSLDKDA